MCVDRTLSRHAEGRLLASGIDSTRLFWCFSLGLEGGNYLRFPRMDVLSNGIFNFTENLLPPPYKSYAACCVNECPPHYVFHQPCTFLHKF